MTALLEYRPEKTQNVTPKRIARLEKQKKFLTLLFQGHITFTQAAEQVGIGRRQAYRWFQKWKLTEGLEVDREWWQLFNRLLDENPERAFEGLTRLKYRMTPDKIQLEEKVTDIKVVIVEHTTSTIQPTPKTTGDPQRQTPISDS